MIRSGRPPSCVHRGSGRGRRHLAQRTSPARDRGERKSGRLLLWRRPGTHPEAGAPERCRVQQDPGARARCAPSGLCRSEKEIRFGSVGPRTDVMSSDARTSTEKICSADYRGNIDRSNATPYFRGGKGVLSPPSAGALIEARILEHRRIWLTRRASSEGADYVPSPDTSSEHSILGSLQKLMLLEGKSQT